MNKFQDANVFSNVVEELNKLDEQNLEIKGMCMKPSQCFHYSFKPVHVLFNTNCPDELREKVLNIFSKYGLANTEEKNEYKVDYLSPDIPASVKELKPQIYKEGESWFASSDSDMSTNISGQGDTPEKAMQNFDDNYSKLKENSV